MTINSTLPPPFDIYESALFTGRFTNTSAEPIWYYAYMPEHPWFRTWVCSPGNVEWTDETFYPCLTWAHFAQLQPGDSLLFKANASASDAGGSIRVELQLYAEASFSSPTFLVSSPDVVIP